MTKKLRAYEQETHFHEMHLNTMDALIPVTNWTSHSFLKDTNKQDNSIHPPYIYKTIPLSTLQLRLRTRTLLLLDLILQHSSQNLTSLRLRNLLDKSHTTTQSLRRSDSLTEPLHDILFQLFGLLDIRTHNDICTGYFGMLLVVPDTNDADVVDVFAAEEFGF